jgi:GxxExxY protein
MSDLLHEEETYAIRGACFEVYNVMGNGFLENVYQECLAIEFVERNIPFIEQPPLGLTYKRHPLNKKYVPDFICYASVIVELKAVSVLTDEHTSQLLRYLHASGMAVGLLVNFGHHPSLETKRLVL